MVRFKRDEMTERERWEAILERQPVDRMPFWLYGIGFAACNVGHPKIRAYDDPEKSFWAQVWSNEMYNSVPYTVYIGGAFPTREFGGEVRMPESEYSMAVSILRPAVESEDDVWKLEVPDVKTAGVMPLFMQYSKLQEKYGYHIHMYSGGTLTRVGYICEVERMCRWILKKPELVHRLCRLETDFILAMNKYWIDTFGPERIIGFTASPTESNDIISPKHFQEFAFPYQKEVHDKALAMGVKHFWTHICGEQNLNLPYWAQFSHGDPGIISIGHEIDIETAAKYFPNDIIMGNMNPAVIQEGTPEEVYQLARTCIEKGKTCPGGFILAPGCELPVKASPYNVWMVSKAVHDFGWYE